MRRPSSVAVRQWWRRQPRLARRNAYRGARVARGGSSVAFVDSAILRDPQRFYERFVARRRPCVIKAIIPELSGKPEGWWVHPDARLKTVQVEARDGPADSFGKGRKVRMKFGDLVDADSAEHYLTTQEVPDGHLLAPPLDALAAAGQLPLRPALMGALVPQSINLWLGRSSTPASSGLHHDFHDNLYVLLRGKKHFRLFSPADANCMYTAGTIARVHANGRINYVGEPPTSADGRTAEDRAAEACRAARRTVKEAEGRLAMAEEAVEQGEHGAQRALDYAEATLDEAMERSVNATRKYRERRRQAAARTATAESSLPPSFSRVSNLPTEWARPAAIGEPSPFPRLQGARMAECDLATGDMLYLPAGWFHEVSSSGAHVALNYWYHPPAVAGTAGASFELPYGPHAQVFWEREWRRTRKA